jgi:hypothetical protein
MRQGALYLLDHVLPSTPLRQWVLTAFRAEGAVDVWARFDGRCRSRLRRLGHAKGAAKPRGVGVGWAGPRVPAPAGRGRSARTTSDGVELRAMRLVLLGRNIYDYITSHPDYRQELLRLVTQRAGVYGACIRQNRQEETPE